MGLSIQIFISLILSVVVGLTLGPDSAPWVKQWIAPVGTIFINLIKMMIVPVIFSSLVTGMTGLGDLKKLGRIGAKTFFIYMGTTAVAILLGFASAFLIQPGVGLDMGAATAPEIKAAPTFMQVLVSMIPANPIASMAKAEILPKEATGDESKKSSNLKLKNFLDKANIKFELSKSEAIQNGDVIQVNAIYDTRLAKFNKIKVINDKFEIKVSDLPNPVKDISEVKNLSQIKKLYENYFISELGRRTDYYSTLYEILGMYSGKDSNGQAILRIYSKIKSRNMYYDGKAVEYDYLELSNLMQNSNNEIISATRATITSDSNLNGEMNSQEMDSRLRLEGFSKIN